MGEGERYTTLGGPAAREVATRVKRSKATAPDSSPVTTCKPCCVSQACLLSTSRIEQDVAETFAQAPQVRRA